MNNRAVFLSVLPFCATALLQAQINPPKIGVVRYADGAVHAVSGLPANYIVDGHALASADAASFSDAGGLIAQNGSISLVDPNFKTVAEYQSGEAAPLLNIDGDLKSAVAWLPHQHALLRWSGTSFVLTDVKGLSASVTVSSLYLAAGNTVELLLTNSDATVSEAAISLDSGELLSLDALPGIRGPAVRQQSFVVFRDDRGVTIATPSAIVETFPLPGLRAGSDLTFERMSSSALHIMSASPGQNWVLHLGKTEPPRLSQLPAEPVILATKLPEAKQ